MLGLLSAPVADAGQQDLALEPTLHPIVSVPGLPPVPLDLDIKVTLVPVEFLGPLFDNLGFHQGSEGSHDAGEKAAQIEVFLHQDWKQTSK